MNPFSSPSSPWQGWSQRHGFFVPLGLVALAAVALLPRAEPEAEADRCTAQDPVRVRVEESVYDIPAVLLPHLYTDDGMVPVVRQDTVDGIEGFSRAGSRLTRWYCESEDGAPISIQGFSVHDDQIADAVAQGELDYRFLPHVNVISVSVAPSSKTRYAEGLTLHALSDRFPFRCGTPATFTYPSSPAVTATYCIASVAISPETLLIVKFYIEEREGQRTINGHEDWPEIAREVEHLIRKMQVTPE